MTSLIKKVTSAVLSRPLHSKMRLLQPLLILLVAFSGCRETILHNLDELQANQVRVLLANSGVDTERLREGANWSISVPSKAATRALTILEQSKVLKRDLRRSAKTSESLLQTREERQHFIERQLAWGLEQTLERLPRVFEARVHLALLQGADLTLDSETRKDTASVLLIVDEQDVVDSLSVKKIVSGASGVEESQVSVIISVSEQAAGERAEAELQVLNQSKIVAEGNRAAKFFATGEPKHSTEILQLGVAAMIALSLALVVRRRLKADGSGMKSFKLEPVREQATEPQLDNPLSPPEMAFRDLMFKSVSANRSAAEKSRQNGYRGGVF